MQLQNLTFHNRNMWQKNGKQNVDFILKRWIFEKMDFYKRKKILNKYFYYWKISCILKNQRVQFCLDATKKLEEIGATKFDCFFDYNFLPQKSFHQRNKYTINELTFMFKEIFRGTKICLMCGWNTFLISSW